MIAPASGRDRLALLAGEGQRLARAADHLEWSMQRCGELGAPPWAADALERLESLASRFARLSDLLTQRVMRLADDIELEALGSLLDRIHRAEKRGWASADGELVRIRELRNLIAHEYEDEDLDALYGEVQRLAPSLVSAARRAALWAASAAAGAPEGAR